MRTMSAKNQKIVKYLNANPDVKPSQVAKLFKVNVVTVYTLKSNHVTAATKTKAKGKWKVASVATSTKSVKDLINHPPHYKVGGIETIDFIEAKNLGYNLGNVVKYISRADHKDTKLANLKKAQWYLNRAVAKMGA